MPPPQSHDMGPREGLGNGDFDCRCLDSMTLDPKKVRQWGFRRPPTQSDDMGPREGCGKGVFNACCHESVTLDPTKFPAMGFSKAAAPIGSHGTPRRAQQWGFRCPLPQFDDARPQENPGNGVFEGRSPNRMTWDPKKVVAKGFSMPAASNELRWTPRKSLQWDFRCPLPRISDSGPQESPGNGVFEGLRPIR